MKEFAIPLLILAGIIILGLTGAMKPSATQNQAPINVTGIQVTGTQVTGTNITGTTVTGQTQGSTGEQVAKNDSAYAGKFSVAWGNITTNQDQEYIEIDASYSNTSPISISGWRLVSSATGQTITIPQSTSLYLANSSNDLGNVVLSPGDRAFIISGRSPIYYGFHTNICSGYLTQFNTFTPSLYTNCPAARNEDLTSIPRTVNNNNCFDLIDSYPTCAISTQPMNNDYSSECQNFVFTKLNYQGCVNTHKNDSNFYSPGSWYVYLNRDQSIWQTRRETLTLYDNVGKKVFSVTH